MPDTHPKRLLPGEELVEEGMADLLQNKNSECALLVLSFGCRLRALGIPVPDRQSDRPFEHLLYELLEERLGKGAHSHYNALVRRMVSYARARDHEVSREQTKSQSAKS